MDKVTPSVATAIDPGTRTRAAWVKRYRLSTNAHNVRRTLRGFELAHPLAEVLKGLHRYGVDTAVPRSVGTVERLGKLINGANTSSLTEMR